MDATNQVTFSLYIVMAAGQFLVVMLFAWGILLYKYRKQARQKSQPPESVQNEKTEHSDTFLEQELQATQEFLLVIENADDVGSVERTKLKQSLDFRMRYLRAEQAASAFSSQHDDAYWGQLGELLQGALVDSMPASMEEGSITTDTPVAQNEAHATGEAERDPLEELTNEEELAAASMAAADEDVSESEMLAAAESELDAAPAAEPAQEEIEVTSESETTPDEENAENSTSRETELLAERNDALKQVIENQEQIIGELKNEKQELEDQLSDLNEQNEFFKTQRKNLQTQIERLQSTMDELYETINEQKETITKLRQSSDNTAAMMSQMDTGSEKGNEEKSAAIENMQLYTKMLEDDNDRLRVELETLKGQVNTAAQSIAEDSASEEPDALLAEDLEEEALIFDEDPDQAAENSLSGEGEPPVVETGQEDLAHQLATTHSANLERGSDTIEVNIDLECQTPNESAYAAADVLGQIAGAQLTALDEIRTQPEFSEQQWLHGGVQRLLETITPVEMTASALAELAENLASQSVNRPDKDDFMVQIDDLLEKLEEKDRMLADSSVQVLEQEKAALSALLNESARSSREMLRCIHSLEDEVMSLREKTNSGVSDAPKAAMETIEPLTLEPSGDPLKDLVEEVQSQSLRNDVEILDLDEPLAEMDEILKDL